MNRRTMLKTVGTTGLLGVGTGAAETAQGCNFVCCEDCRIAYCPDGCDCQRNCNEGVKEE